MIATVRFDSYLTLIDDDALGPQAQVPTQSLSTLQLLREPSAPNLGELAWRIGLALAAFNLVVIALAVANFNPRVGRSGNLVLALFSFVAYYNLINLGQSWIASGRFPLPGFLLVLHGGVFLAALTALAVRHNQWSLRRLVRKPMAEAAS